MLSFVYKDKCIFSNLNRIFPQFSLKIFKINNNARILMKKLVKICKILPIGKMDLFQYWSEITWFLFLVFLFSVLFCIFVCLIVFQDKFLCIKALAALEFTVDQIVLTLRHYPAYSSLILGLKECTTLPININSYSYILPKVTKWLRFIYFSCFPLVFKIP